MRQKQFLVFTLGLLIAAPDPVNLAKGWISNQLIVAHVEIFADVKHQSANHQIIAYWSDSGIHSVDLEPYVLESATMPGGYSGKITCLRDNPISTVVKRELILNNEMHRS